MGLELSLGRRNVNQAKEIVAVRTGNAPGESLRWYYR